MAAQGRNKINEPCDIIKVVKRAFLYFRGDFSFNISITQCNRLKAGTQEAERSQGQKLQEFQFSNCDCVFVHLCLSACMTEKWRRASVCVN